MAFYIFFFIFFLIPSLFEGLGLLTDRRFFLLYSFISAPFLYFYLVNCVKSIKIPLKAGIAYLLFLFFSTISTLFLSFDKQTSFELLLFYFFSFLIFLFFYNQKNLGYLTSHYSPIILGIFFTCYSLITPFLKGKVFTFLIPTSEKQFVFASYMNHNHLGDFLGLFVLIFCYYSFQKKWIYLPFFIFFFTIFLGSFSRSAYVAFFIVFILMLFYTRKKFSSLLLPFIFLFLSSIIVATYLLSIQLPVSSSFFRIQQYTKNSLNIAPRDIFSGHDIFIKQALLSIQKYPLFGIGGGNFILASQNNIFSNIFSDSAHSIFFELATELGIPATMCFLFFIFLVSKSALSFPSLPGFLFLYLLLNFQTDYTYQIYSLFLFWIILSAYIHRESKEFIISSAIYGTFCMLVLFVLVCIMTSTLFVKMGDYPNALRWYPLNKNAYISAIQKSNSKTPSYISQAQHIAPYDLTLNESIANYYLKSGDKVIALRYYEKIYNANHLCSFYFVKKIYILKKEVYSERTATTFFERVVFDYTKIFIP
ncbi:MAG: O-antigen ligase family protein [Candidatus Roizmanbacteria bacterium]|nr:O-antigen ligase family protein [Candidatus Roizmanbacteria bacterium]